MEKNTKYVTALEAGATSTDPPLPIKLAALQSKTNNPFAFTDSDRILSWILSVLVAQWSVNASAADYLAAMANVERSIELHRRKSPSPTWSEIDADGSQNDDASASGSAFGSRSGTGPAAEGKGGNNGRNHEGGNLLQTGGLGARAAGKEGGKGQLRRGLSFAGRFETSRLEYMLGKEAHFFTRLPIRQAFEAMDRKYAISRRRFVQPSIHEVRQTVNLAQVIASANHLKLITLDGDETLYGDGKDFADEELAALLINLLCNGCTIALVTAAGYGTSPEPYQRRLGALLQGLQRLASTCATTSTCTTGSLPLPAPFFLSESQVESHSESEAFVNFEEVRKRFWVFGGECNYLFRLNSRACLESVPAEEWEPLSPILSHPHFAARAEKLLNVAEEEFQVVINELGCRAKIIRKARAVGVVPGGYKGFKRMPQGSGAKFIRPEMLAEFVERVTHRIDSMQREREYFGAGAAETFIPSSNDSSPGLISQAVTDSETSESVTAQQTSSRSVAQPLTLSPSKVSPGRLRTGSSAFPYTHGPLPYCAFNGGSDVWVDVGNKAIGIEILQKLHNIRPHECIHMGDQFSAHGNDYAVRSVSPCVWVVNPLETKAVMRRITRLTNAGSTYARVVAATGLSHTYTQPAHSPAHTSTHTSTHTPAQGLSRTPTHAAYRPVFAPQNQSMRENGGRTPARCSCSARDYCLPAPCSVDRRTVPVPEVVLGSMTETLSSGQKTTPQTTRPSRDEAESEGRSDQEEATEAISYGRRRRSSSPKSPGANWQPEVDDHTDFTEDEARIPSDSNLPI